MSLESQYSEIIHQIVVKYLMERLAAGTISIEEAVKTLRVSSPKCTLTNCEIADLITESAIDAGFVVRFEGE